MLFTLTVLLSLPQIAPVAENHWGKEHIPEQRFAPETVAFRRGHALEFERKRQTRLDIGRGKNDSLRLTGALTLAAVIQLDAAPPTKVSLISKWHLRRGGRSYELGVTASRRLFFTISASGTWPHGARELLSTRSLEPGIPYAVHAVFQPGKQMALYVNGATSGALTDGVPDAIFDSPTPVYFGNRPGSEAVCGLEGKIALVKIYAAALDGAQASELAKQWKLTAPPPREFALRKPPYDLSLLRQEVRAWYEKHRAADLPYGAYRLYLRPGSRPDLYGSDDIVWIRWIMRDLDLSGEQRRQWIDFIQDQQDPATGKYRHLTGHPPAHALCSTTAALNMLGGTHRHPVHFLEAHRGPATVPAWLEGINWKRPWGASHDIWGIGLPLLCSKDTPGTWKKALFDWLDREVDPATGFWRQGVKVPSRLEGLGGAFHIWPLYACDDRALPHPKKVIDGVLDLQLADGSFDGHFNYGNMDAVWVLDHLLRAVPARAGDITSALARSLAGLMRQRDTMPGRFFSDTHGTLSRIATLAILQAALPERFVVTKEKWRNPWSRKRLYELKFEHR